MISARRRTTRACGYLQHDCLCTRVGLHLLPTHSYVNSWSSCLFQCHTYLVPVKLRSTWWWDEAKSAFVGPFSWLSCARTQVHMFACLLFASVCMRHTPTRSRSTRAIRISLRTRFHEQHNCPFLAEKYVTIEVALVNSIVPDPSLSLSLSVPASCIVPPKKIVLTSVRNSERKKLFSKNCLQDANWHHT
jgi:hypothetical protein